MNIFKLLKLEVENSSFIFKFILLENLIRKLFFYMLHRSREIYIFFINILTIFNIMKIIKIVQSENML